MSFVFTHGRRAPAVSGRQSHEAFSGTHSASLSPPAAQAKPSGQGVSSLHGRVQKVPPAMGRHTPPAQWTSAAHGWHSSSPSATHSYGLTA